MRILLVFLLSLLPADAQWQPQNSGTDASLRGISAVSDRVAWASGAKGTVLRTVDGGEHWQRIAVDGAQALDFRDIQAIDADTAYILSIGPGEQSRIYKTADAGQHWKLQFTNRDPKAFYDCFAFWDSKHGIALSDSIDGRFPLLTTADGESWTQVTPQTMPAALNNEGAFAASGTCITTQGKKDVWFVTGGPAARVFHSRDRGRNWTVVNSPIISGAAPQGIFSIAFRDRTHGVIAGGDYQNAKSPDRNMAITGDGGEHWELMPGPPGYRSAVAFLPGSAKPTMIAVGTTGSDFFVDGGKSWISLDTADYNALSLVGPAVGWAVGPNGRIARFTGLPKP